MPRCHAPLPTQVMHCQEQELEQAGRQHNQAVLQIPLCWRRSFPSSNYGGAAGTSLARLDPGVRPGSKVQTHSKDSADVF